MVQNALKFDVLGGSGCAPTQSSEIVTEPGLPLPQPTEPNTARWAPAWANPQSTDGLGAMMKQPLSSWTPICGGWVTAVVPGRTRTAAESVEDRPSELTARPVMMMREDRYQVSCTTDLRRPRPLHRAVRFKQGAFSTFADEQAAP